MKPLITIVMLCCVLAQTTIAQEGKKDRADKKFDEFAYVDARNIYLKVAQKGFESADLFQKIADSYYFNGEYGEATTWYKKLVTKFPQEILPEYYFRFAQSLRAQKDYDLSDTMMATFNERNGSDTRAALFEEEPNYLRNIAYKKSAYTLEDIRSINSRFSDFAPTEYEGKLIFASSRDTGGSSRKIHKWNNQPFLDLYKGSFNEETKEFEDIDPFSRKLNSKFHESTTTFSPDGKTVYFTRNNYNRGRYKKDEHGTNKLKIYKSYKKNSSWSKPVEMPFNSDEYSTAHPTLSADGKKLYFASDMPGTIGLSDIWVVSIDDTDVVSEPLNLGRPVNTEGRETFPFISMDRNLYFASDGHPGLGGLDVFVTILRDDQRKDESVENIGEPVNSSYDDFSFIVNDATQIGYFASNRKRGLGSDDIYRFIKSEMPCEITIKGTITDRISNQPIAGAVVNVLEDDQSTPYAVVTDQKGQYSLLVDCDRQYVVRAVKTGFTPSETIAIAPDVSGTFTLDLELVKELKAIEVGDDLSKVMNLNPIYFDVDRFNIGADAALELEKVLGVMLLYPKMEIDVRSHTDSRGRSSYNLNLSDKRAKATIAYIIGKGIHKSRIQGRGYGEKEILNRCKNGVKCPDPEHAMNRRSEFIVVKK